MSSTRPRGTIADPPGATAQGLIDAFEAAIPQAARQTAEAIRAEIPGYDRIGDPALFEDVQRHVLLNLELLERSLRQMRPVTNEDLVFV